MAAKAHKTTKAPFLLGTGAPLAFPPPVVAHDPFVIAFDAQSPFGGSDAITIAIPSGEEWELIASSAGNKDGAVDVYHMAALANARSDVRGALPGGTFADAGHVPLFSASYVGTSGLQMVVLDDGSSGGAGKFHTYNPGRPVTLRGGDKWVWGFVGAGILTVNHAQMMARRVA